MEKLYTNKELFHSFKETRLKDPRNAGRSFTAWSCFYDFWKDRNTDNYEEREQLETAVQDYYGLTPEQTEKMDFRALLELCDLSILDDIARFLYYDQEE